MEVGWGLGQDLEQDWGPLQEQSDLLECLPVGRGFVFPATGLASLLLREVQGLAGGKKVEAINNSQKISKEILGSNNAKQSKSKLSPFINF